MCVNSYQQFTKCCHVLTTMTTCPTYHKQQQSTKGFLGGLFRQNLKNMKNCGKIVPHYLEIKGFCQTCSVKQDRLRAQRVGQGAMRVRKQCFQEILREDQKRAARNALYKAVKQRHQHNHDVLHAETSVWLNDLYHQPEKLAKDEAYARKAALAPPVSSHRREKSDQSRAGEARSRGPPAQELLRIGMIKEPEPERRGEWMPCYGGSQPMKKPLPPAPTHRYSGHSSSSGSTALPPAIGIPPCLQLRDRSFAARAKAAGFPDPRQEPEHIRDERRGRTPPGEHVGHWRAESPTRFEAAMPNMFKRVKEKAPPRNEGSDVSFMCETSRKISDEQPQSKGERRRLRKQQ
ncbi:hypothetical protein F5Y07DRAFT_257627 [Xylaria sp. FL0933]|nr:hypothetical protein F5Y07DRAFT_257627 [Xylaria sp. FL0933]